ncbi:MAG: radical SAM protein [Thermoplasmata archaeon]
MEQIGAHLKAKLLVSGTVDVKVRLPVGYVCRDAAGPHGNRKSVFVKIGNHKVKLGVGRSNYSIVSRGKEYYLLESGREVCRVEFLKPVFHAPEMAFFNLVPYCDYDCAFCNLPHGKQKEVPSVRYIELIRGNIDKIKSIAVTSGVSNVETCVKLTGKFLTEVKQFALPVGVEPFVSMHFQIDYLKSCGADEIKINLHSFDPNVLEKYCPAFKRNTFSLLEHAVKVFGEGKVCTNVLVGLGENMENTIAGLEKLTEIGVLANLRYVHGFAGMPPEKLLYLAKEYKKILINSNLKPVMKTMCLRCTACDIVPFVDI